MSINKTIISGGQTGADQAGIQAALKMGFDIGGYAALNYWTEQGPNYNLKKYGLLESKVKGYKDRDKLNVDMCDVVIAFRLSKPKTGRGTTQTFNYAAYGTYSNSTLPIFDTITGVTEIKYNQDRKPVIVLWDPMNHINKSQFPTAIKQFIEKYDKNNLKILITGPCESTLPGIQSCITELLVEALKT